MPKVNLFISYSHHEKDEYLPELLNYINEANCPKINIWYDEKISPGTEWDDQIKDKLNKADIVLLLLSQYFLTSKYINEHELDVSLERHNAGNCRVIPIFIRKCVLDVYPEIKKLQGLPRDMSFISDMGEEKWGHYTDIVQNLNDIAHEIETNRNILQASTQGDNNQSNLAKTIEEIRDKRKIFLSIPDTEEGKKKRRDFAIQVEGKIKYEGWPYEIVPGVLEAEQLSKKTEAEFTQAVDEIMEQCIYSIHIISSDSDLGAGLSATQLASAKNYKERTTFFKSLVWLLHPELKSSLPTELSMFPISTGNDYDNLFNLVADQDNEKEKQINQLKKSFSPAKKVYMFYDFTKDHDRDLRIKLKTKIEANENLAVRFSPPNPSLEKEREDLNKCEGGCIFYGTADTQWFVVRQSILLDAGYTQSKAICLDDPDIERKAARDVSKNDFITIKGESDLDLGVRNFLDRLQNNV